MLIARYLSLLCSNSCNFLIQSEVPSLSSTSRGTNPPIEEEIKKRKQVSIPIYPERSLRELGTKNNPYRYPQLSLVSHSSTRPVNLRLGKDKRRYKIEKEGRTERQERQERERGERRRKE